MSSSFLSSHPDFTSPPPSLGPLTLHPSLNNSYSNNPIEKFHFRTVQRIVKEHSEFTEAYQLPAPRYESARALKYSLRRTPTHRPIKMSAKQTMTWNGTLYLPPLTASKNEFMELQLRACSSLDYSRIQQLSFWLMHQFHPLTELIRHLHRRSQRQAPPRNPQSHRREAGL